MLVFSSSFVSGAIALAKAAAPSDAPATFNAVRRLILVMSVSFVWAWQEAVAGGRHWQKLAKSGCVRVVAADAMVAFAWTALKVPVPTHAAVRAMVVISRLRAVALATELHRFAQRKRCAICQMQQAAVFSVVAGGA